MRRADSELAHQLIGFGAAMSVCMAPFCDGFPTSFFRLFLRLGWGCFSPIVFLWPCLIGASVILHPAAPVFLREQPFFNLPQSVPDRQPVPPTPRPALVNLRIPTKAIEPKHAIVSLESATSSRHARFDHLRRSTKAGQLPDKGE